MLGNIILETGYEFIFSLRNVPTSILLQKKAKCDTKALKIVQRLIEPNVEVDWLLESLGQINRAHMEDIVEERAIEKICGYVLCNNLLTKIVNKKYQISALRNKVYDIEKVKNFCSYSCYIAMDHIMMQMLTSPLWLRNREEIPVFHILPQKKRRTNSPPGVEINIMGIELLDDVNEVPVPEEESNKSHTELKQDTRDQILKEQCQTEDQGCTKVSYSTADEAYITSNMEKIQINYGEVDQVASTNQDSGTNSLSQLSENISSLKITTDVSKIDFDFESLGSEHCVSKPDAAQSESPATSSLPTIIDETVKSPRRKNSVKNREKAKSIVPLETLTTRIEKNFSEWITEDTINLLYGDEINKQQIIENVTRQDKYMVLCRKLNKIQLQEEKDDNNSSVIQPENLKPAPDYSMLEEESRNLEIKVRASYEGKTNVEMSEKKDKTEQVEENTNFVPLTDAHDPRALRRRIFLDKLNKVLPDLLHALIGPSHTHCAYKAEKIMSVKILIATFNLSATNIIFRTAEWTLVGLIIIKMLGIIDPAIKSLLLTQKATMYMSMILMAYKLDSIYLDHLINSRIIPPKISCDSTDEDD